MMDTAPKTTPRTPREVIAEWVAIVRRNAVSASISLTPPANRWEKTERNAQRLKHGIKRLKQDIKFQFTAYRGVPSSPDKIHGLDGVSPTHIYIRAKDKGKPRPTNLPTLGSAPAVLQWWQGHSTMTDKGKRHANADAYAFVSGRAVMTQAAREIQARAGVFAAGWYTLFDKLGMNIKPFTTPAALGKAKAHNLSSTYADKSGDIRTFNEANSHPGMERYTQRLIDTDIHKKADKYSRNPKMRAMLDKMLAKACGLDKNAAARVTQNIKIDLAI